jgi:predicted  nucleic acid-binding Zn-ribbon protein
MSSPNGECSKCGYVGPPEADKTGCPKCGGAWKTMPAEDSAASRADTGEIELAPLPYLEDKELVSTLRLEMKDYLQRKLSVKKVIEISPETQDSNVELLPSIFISDPNFASVATAWIALGSQEQQGKLNLRLQWLIAFLAAATLVTALLPYIYPR